MRLKLLIGLGNPGKEYLNTYHNVGILFLRHLSKNSSNPIPYTLLASNIYMNDSGHFVARTLKKSGAKPEELLIIHDDSDLELGKFKLSFGRGSAGHKGILSIINALKTKNFWRLRIGIRPVVIKESPLTLKLRRAPASDFVLKKIAESHAEILTRVFNQALAKIREILA